MNIWFFNPENDLCLANGDTNFMPPASARKMADDLALLPLCWSSAHDKVITGHEVAIEIPEHAELRPWGWSAWIVARMIRWGIPENRLPSVTQLEKIRMLSHRSLTIEILGLLGSSMSLRGLKLPDLPLELRNEQEVFELLERCPEIVLKTPWSSSGKGLCWCNATSSLNIGRWIISPLRKMGSLMAEKIYDKIADFAMGFEIDSNDKTCFVGYSLFDTDARGAYASNKLWSNDMIKEYLSGYVSQEDLDLIQVEMSSLLIRILKGHYRGYVGVDMMIYRSQGVFHIHPCVEVNLRMTMGIVARLFYDRHIEPGQKGIFKIAFNPVEGALLNLQKQWLEQNTVVSGDQYPKGRYIPLTPVRKDTHYHAMAMMDIS